MSVYGRGDPWGVPLEIVDRPLPEDQRSRNNSPAALSPSSSSDATHHSWLLPRHRPMPRKRYVDLGCLIVSRRIFLWSLATLLSSALLVSLVILVRKAVPHHHSPLPAPDNYTVALHHALMFFNAQRSGRLPKDNNVTWRGISGLTDDVVGGYYDDGSAAKNTFHTSFAMTMLSWSAIEYRGKYEAAGELDHVKDIIKWGLDYLLKTFNASADVFGGVVEHVGSEKDESCWMRPEDIDYPRTSSICQSSCPDLATEMVAALASASILFKDDDAYSKVLVHGAQTLWKFTRQNPGENDTVLGEFVWGGAWLYLATGNTSYLSELSAMIGNAHDALASPASGVLSLDKKLIGAQVLLTRLRMFLSPGYPYEETLEKFHNQTNIIMCSYLPVFKSFERTKDGMILLNNGKPRPLQYVVNAAFLASLYSDYLETVDIPGWFCGPRFFSIDALRDFARFQINYILGNNFAKISYVVGYGSKYPQHVHHRGASIPVHTARVGCEGWKWRDSKKSDPNTIVGAMVAGPDKRGEFHDDRINYNYTEPTLAGNAGLVAALVSLSGEQGALDRNTMFSSVQPMFPKTPPSSPPWHP